MIHFKIHFADNSKTLIKTRTKTKILQKNLKKNKYFKKIKNEKDCENKRKFNQNLKKNFRKANVFFY